MLTPWNAILKKVLQYLIYSIIPQLRLNTIRESYLYNVLGEARVVRQEHEAAGRVVISLARKAC